MIKSYIFFGVHFTSWCPLGCDHCFTNSSPHNSKNCIDLNLVEMFAKCVKKRNPNIRMVITGGEPLVFKDSLILMLKKIHNLNIKVTIHTNGFWGGTSWSITTLEILKSLGLDRINISIDDYHIKKLPLHKIRKAIKTTIDLNIETRILVAYGESKLLPSNILDELDIHCESLEVIPISLSRSGKAESLPENSFSPTDQVGWCPKLLNPVLYSNGELSPCSGSVFSSICRPSSWSELHIKPKSINDFDRVLDNWERDPLLHGIAKKGPRAIHSQLLKKYHNKQLNELQRAGGCECESCNELFSDLRLREQLNNLRQYKVNPWIEIL